MSKILAKCPYCNNFITIEDNVISQECESCKKTIKTTEALNAYQYYQKNAVMMEKNMTKPLNAKNDVNSKSDFFLAQADLQLEISNYAEAKRYYEKALEENSANAAAWFGIVKCKTKKFTDFTCNNYEEELIKATSFANDEMVNDIKIIMQKYNDSKDIFYEKLNKAKAKVIQNSFEERMRALDDTLFDRNKYLTTKFKAMHTINIFLYVGSFIVLFMACIFGGTSIFASNATVVRTLVGVISLFVLCFACFYYSIRYYNNILLYKKICQLVLVKKIESIEQLTISTNQNKYALLTALQKMIIKGFLKDFIIIDNEFIIYQNRNTTKKREL